MKKLKTIFLAADCFKDAQLTLTYEDDSTVMLPATVFGEFVLDSTEQGCRAKGFCLKTFKSIQHEGLSRSDIKAIINQLPTFLPTIEDNICSKCTR